MTQTCTQKRYRQYHHDNTAPRFRDLPPRFKRQKSSSSKTESEETSLENQENTDFVQSPLPLSDTMKQPMSNAIKPNVPFSDPALSVNTKLYSSTPFQVVDQYGRGYLCYQECVTPPMSPYGIMNNRQTESPEHCVSPSPFSKRTNSSEAMSPCLEMAKVAGPVSKNGVGNLQNNQQSCPVESTNTKSPGQYTDFSDPDLRTMEMLRELERVADQKEKEDQERERKEREESGNPKDGNDRKNYVSHHLRMLMCAVDRYTADIEEDLPTKSNENDTSSYSPKPNVWQTKELSKQFPVTNSTFKDVNNVGQVGKSNPVWQQTNGQYRPYAYPPSQQWCNTQQQQFGRHQISPSPVLMPLASAPGGLLPTTPPLMHHILTPPPSRTSSPHPSPCLQKSALPVNQPNNFFSQLHGHQKPLVSKALEFGSENDGKSQNLATPINYSYQADCSGQRQNGWDLWSSPSIFDIHSNGSAQKERKPLYNR